jgi:serine/threonine-protein kinase
MPVENNPPLLHPVGPQSDPLIGTVLAGRYRIVRSIGQGGMGNVYEALQKPLDRRVALKLLRADSERDPQFRKRFLLEASVSAKLSHPNTITMLDYGSTESGQLYIVMELLTGRTLSRAMQTDGPFGPARAVHIARQVARSLREAHSIGIIHRDLKPANVFLRDQDEADFVKVLDFGLVKVFGEGVQDDNTHRGVFMGTPQYVSPEQARDQAPDQRADIYSLGVLLFHMLTGRVPFDADNSVDIILKQVTEPTPQLASVQPGIEVPPELEAIVRRCLAKRREDRFQSMDEVLEALKRAGAAVGAADTQPSLPPTQPDAFASDPTPKPSTQPGFAARTRTQPPRAQPLVAPHQTQPPQTRRQGEADGRSQPAAPQAMPGTLSPAAFAPKSESVVHRRVLPALLLVGGVAGAAAIAFTIRGQGAEAPNRASKQASAQAPAAASIAGGTPSAAGQPAGASDAAKTQALFASARNVPAFALHREAISEKQPDLPADIASAHRGERLAGMYKVCIAPDGTVAAVTTVQSIAGADEAIANRIRSGWKYKAQTAVLCAVIPLQYEVQ